MVLQKVRPAVEYQPMYRYKRTRNVYSSEQTFDAVSFLLAVVIFIHCFFKLHAVIGFKIPGFGSSDDRLNFSCQGKHISVIISECVLQFFNIYFDVYNLNLLCICVYLQAHLQLLHRCESPFSV